MLPWQIRYLLCLFPCSNWRCRCCCQPRRCDAHELAPHICQPAARGCVLVGPHCKRGGRGLPLRRLEDLVLSPAHLHAGAPVFNHERDSLGGERSHLFFYSILVYPILLFWFVILSPMLLLTLNFVLCAPSFCHSLHRHQLHTLTCCMKLDWFLEGSGC
jgi:hypothetical protein